MFITRFVVVDERRIDDDGLSTLGKQILRIQFTTQLSKQAKALVEKSLRSREFVQVHEICDNANVSRFTIIGANVLHGVGNLCVERLLHSWIAAFFIGEQKRVEAFRAKVARIVGAK